MWEEKLRKTWKQWPWECDPQNVAMEICTNPTSSPAFLGSSVYFKVPIRWHFCSAQRFLMTPYCSQNKDKHPHQVSQSCTVTQSCFQSHLLLPLVLRGSSFSLCIHHFPKCSPYQPCSPINSLSVFVSPDTLPFWKSFQKYLGMALCLSSVPSWNSSGCVTLRVMSVKMNIQEWTESETLKARWPVWKLQWSMSRGGVVLDYSSVIS